MEWGGDGGREGRAGRERGREGNGLGKGGRVGLEGEKYASRALGG